MNFSLRSVFTVMLFSVLTMMIYQAETKQVALQKEIFQLQSQHDMLPENDEVNWPYIKNANKPDLERLELQKHVEANFEKIRELYADPAQLIHTKVAVYPIPTLDDDIVEYGINVPAGEQVELQLHPYQLRGNLIQPLDRKLVPALDAADSPFSFIRKSDPKGVDDDDGIVRIEIPDGQSRLKIRKAMKKQVRKLKGSNHSAISYRSLLEFYVNEELQMEVELEHSALWDLSRRTTCSEFVYLDDATGRSRSLYRLDMNKKLPPNRAVLNPPDLYFQIRARLVREENWSTDG